MSIYIYMNGFFVSCFISWLPITGRIFSKTWIRMMVEVVYILYSFFLLYSVSFTSMTAQHNHRCDLKDIFCLFCYFWIHISKICTFWTKIQGYYIARSVLRTLVIFFFLSCVAIAHLLQRHEDFGICWNHLQKVFPWLSQVTNVLEYYLLFWIPNLEYGSASSLQYM